MLHELHMGINHVEEIHSFSWGFEFELLRVLLYYIVLSWLLNMGIHEKGSGDVVSAVCNTLYTIYPSLCTQTAETTSPESFA